MTDPKCKHCNGEMKPGKAFQSTFNSGMPDFPGDKNVVTLSPGGPGKLIDCLKCVSCGWSMTEPKGLFVGLIAEHPGLSEGMKAMDELTDERLLELAHRIATKYTHAVLVTGGPAFTFSKAHIVDFARALDLACDEPGCWNLVECGTPTPNGYRSTCGKHRPKEGTP